MSLKYLFCFTIGLALFNAHTLLVSAKDKFANYAASEAFVEDLEYSEDFEHTKSKESVAEEPNYNGEQFEKETLIPPYFYLPECQRKLDNFDDECDQEISVKDENEESDYTEQDSKNKKYELPHCFENRSRIPVLLISTLDGRVTGIDFHTGDVLWSHVTDPEQPSMLSSSMSMIEVTSRGEWVRLIPSLNGGIYRFDGETVEALPVTAESLLHSSFKFNDDTIFTGGRTSEIIGIIPESGELKYVCDSSGCNHQKIESPDTLIIKRVSQTVRAIDPKSGNERWNFSVGLHELNVAKGGCESDFSSSSNDDAFHINSTRHHFIIPDGIIRALDSEGSFKWQRELSSAIVDVWTLIDGELEQIDLFNSTYVPALRPGDLDKNLKGDVEVAMYIGISDRQLYVKQNANSDMNRKTNFLQQFLSTDKHDVAFPKVEWKPYLATSVSRTPVVHHSISRKTPLLDFKSKSHNTDLVVRHNLDYPYDNGFYLFGGDSTVLNESEHLINMSTDETDSSPEVKDKLFQPDGIIKELWFIIYQFSYEYWKLLAVFVPICIILNYCFLRFAFIFIQNITLRNARLFVQNVLINIFRENEQVLLIIRRMGLQMQYLPPPPPPQPPSPIPTPRPNSLSLAPPEIKTHKQESNFPSRYASDFQPIDCLGKGGFGVVFRVRNKLDENEYALKRIILPLKESSADRMKREARTLAKLNHPNIVRYYTSWLETLPVDSQENKWWQCTDASSVFSPEIIEDINSNTHTNKGDAKTENLKPPLSCSVDLESSWNNDSDIIPEYSTSSDESDSEDVQAEEELSQVSSDDNSLEIVFKNHSTAKEENDSIDVVFRDTSQDISSPMENNSLSKNVSNNTKNDTLNNSYSDSKLVPRTYMYIQMELCQKESLREWLVTNSERDLAKVLSIYNNILHAVEYVHENQLIHRDLKPSNIFFSLDGGVKVGDFGLVTTIDDEIENSDGVVAMTPGLKQRTHDVGTQLYMSPEQIDGKNYNYKIDIFSLGMIFYEMLVYFGTEMERRNILSKIRNREFDGDFIKKYPKEVSLLKEMLHPEASKRPTTRGIRASNPFQHLQVDLLSIKAEEQYHLLRKRTHSNSLSDSNSGNSLEK